MKIYFVRHGETDWNKERRIQGRADIPLNEFGRHLARETAKGLESTRFDVCYTSPLKRAKETAELILEGRNVPIIEEEQIIEMDFGACEGKCCSTSGWELPDSFEKFFDDMEHYEAPEGGEDFTEVRSRVGGFLKELYGKEQYKDSNILITTHGAALAGMLNIIKQEPISRYWGEGVHKNCAVTIVEVENQIPHIVAENQVYYKDEVEPWDKK